MSFEIEWIEDTARFAQLAPEWDAVLPPDSRPFDLHCWHLAWLEAFASGHELAVCTIRDGGTLAGVLPLQRNRRNLEALANPHSVVFRPLAAGPEAMEVLVGAALDGAAKLIVRELRDGDRGAEALAEGAREARMALFAEPASTASIIDTSEDFEPWLKGSHTRWKKNLRASQRKMSKNFEAAFEVARSPDDLETELAQGFAVEASGWKGQAGTAIVSKPETEAFYRRIAAVFQDRDELRLSHIRLDGELAAFAYCLEHRGRLYGLKSGYDERFRKFSPGLVMQLAIVERCFEGEVSAFELLGNRTDWKAKFETSQRTHRNLRAYGRHPATLARYAYRSAVRPRLRAARRRLRSDR